jgi:hypothetical protein
MTGYDRDEARCCHPIGIPGCATAPKWDPSKNRLKPLILNYKRNMRGVPIGADWDPCKTPIFFESMSCGRFAWGPTSVPIYIYKLNEAPGPAPQ